MLDVLHRELREKGAIRFPHLCDFHLKRRIGRVFKNYHMPQGVYKPGFYSVAMRATYSVKRYFKNFSFDNPGKSLGPMERESIPPPLV